MIGNVYGDAVDFSLFILRPSFFTRYHLLLTTFYQLILLDFPGIRWYHPQTMIILLHSLWLLYHLSFSCEVLLASSSKNKSTSQWMECRALCCSWPCGNDSNISLLRCWSLPWEIHLFSESRPLHFEPPCFHQNFRSPNQCVGPRPPPARQRVHISDWGVSLPPRIRWKTLAWRPGQDIFKHSLLKGITPQNGTTLKF